MRKILLVAALLSGFAGAAQAQQARTTCTPFTAPPTKAGSDSATIRVIRPADNAGVNDPANIRLYMKPEVARLDLDGKIQQVFDCPGDTVGYRLVPTKADGGNLIFEIPVRADAGSIKVVACNAMSGNCFRGEGKAGGEVLVELYQRPTVTQSQNDTSKPTK